MRTQSACLGGRLRVCIDKKALQILLDAYWLQKAWKPGDPVDRAAFEYARQAGYMFDAVTVTHDDIFVRLLAVRARITLERVTDAFLASLGTRRLELRSALGSFSVAAQFPDHRLVEQTHARMPSGRLHCRVCGRYGGPIAEQEDLNVLSFERWKWGGIRHVDPLYAWFDLTQFEKADVAVPTRIMRSWPGSSKLPPTWRRRRSRMSWRSASAR